MWEILDQLERYPSWWTWLREFAVLPAGALMVKVRDLLAGDVVVLLGERLTVAATPRVEGNTAVVATAQGVTLYLRGAGRVALAGHNQARDTAERRERVASSAAARGRVRPPAGSAARRAAR